MCNHIEILHPLFNFIYKKEKNSVLYKIIQFMLRLLSLVDLDIAMLTRMFYVKMMGIEIHIIYKEFQSKKIITFISLYLVSFFVTFPSLDFSRLLICYTICIYDLKTPKTCSVAICLRCWVYLSQNDWTMSNTEISQKYLK